MNTAEQTTNITRGDVRRVDERRARRYGVEAAWEVSVTTPEFCDASFCVADRDFYVRVFCYINARFPGVRVGQKMWGGLASLRVTVFAPKARPKDIPSDLWSAVDVVAIEEVIRAAVADAC